MFTLRPYQSEAVAIALAHLWHTSAATNGLMVLPTASGKSLVIADICHKLDAPVLILQPSKELLEQNYAKLQSYGITDIGIYSASKRTKEIAKFTYATIGSIIRKPELFDHFKYVIIDEAHLVAPGGQYTTFLKALRGPRVIGLTATPYRLVTEVRRRTDGKNWSTTRLALLTDRGQFFHTLLYVRSIAQLTRDGYLAPVKYHGGSLGGRHSLKVNASGTEFTELSLANYWSESSVVALSAWIESLPHNRILVFVPTLEMAHYMAQSLGTMMVSGDMPEAEREHVLKRFREGSIHTLVNVGVLTTGYDLPSLEAVVLARPTMSLSLYTQMVGRVLRLDPDNDAKVAHVYDFGDNFDRFGPVEQVKVELDGVYAGIKCVTGVVLAEVCVSDIMARRSAKTAAAAF